MAREAETAGGRRWLPRAVVGVALLAAGLGAFMVGSALDTAEAEVTGPNAAINAGASDRRVIEANNSPAVARNPVDRTNLALANRIDTPTFACALNLSFDSGATWDRTAIPFPAGEELPERCFAPDAAFAADGQLHVVFVTLKGAGNVPNAGWLVSSTDGGRTLSAPRRLLGPFAFQARLGADPAASGRLYLSWVQATGTAGYGFPQPGNPVQVSRSDDSGVTWSDPVRVSPAARQRVVAPSLEARQGGRLFVSYLDLGDDSLDYHGGHEGKGGPPYPGPWSLVLGRSDDGGVTWEEAVVDASVIPIERVIVFEAPYPSLAVDASGDRVFVGYHDGRLGDADVWVWRSTDGGRTFAAPTRVNDTARRDGRAQYLPELGLSGSRLDVVYYDRRADRADVRNEVSFQFSSDGGRTFSPSIRLSDRPFDSRVGFGRERGLPDLGSRLGLLSTPERSLAVWTDTRGGTRAANKQDLARVVVAVTTGSSLRQPLRVGGAALGLVALGVCASAAWALVRARRERKPVPGAIGG